MPRRLDELHRFWRHTGLRAAYADFNIIIDKCLNVPFQTKLHDMPLRIYDEQMTCLKSF